MDQALSAAYAPFTFALGLMAALLLLESVFVLLGVSLHGHDLDTEIPGEVAALHAQFDLAHGATPDVPHLLEASAALNQVEPSAPETGFMAAIGLHDMPLMIWLAAMLFSFGLGGYLFQALTASALPTSLVALLAAAAGLIFTRQFAKVFGRFVPRLETSATSAQFMGGLRGVVTQGTARAGSAAEVRLRDRHGNIHYMRCEPFSPSDEIGEGTEVLTLRERLGPDRWSLRILPLS